MCKVAQAHPSSIRGAKINFRGTAPSDFVPCVIGGFPVAPCVVDRQEIAANDGAVRADITPRRPWPARKSLPLAQFMFSVSVPRPWRRM